MNQSLIADLSTVVAAVEAVGLFSSLCTIQEAFGSPDVLGQSDLVDWADVDGLTDIPCMSAPLTIMKPSVGDERDAPTFTADMDTFHVLLDGYYPQILQRYRAVIDGVAMDIKGVESDSQKIMTRMACKRINL